jgi:hypothetical protein
VREAPREWGGGEELNAQRSFLLSATTASVCSSRVSRTSRKSMSCRHAPRNCRSNFRWALLLWYCSSRVVRRGRSSTLARRPPRPSRTV